MATGANTTGATVQLKVSLALAVPSEAVTVTVSGVLLTVAVIVPEISPVVLLMLKPDGRPVAL